MRFDANVSTETFGLTPAQLIFEGLPALGLIAVIVRACWRAGARRTEAAPGLKSGA